MNRTTKKIGFVVLALALGIIAFGYGLLIGMQGVARGIIS